MEDVLSNQDKLNQRYTKIQNTSSGRFNRKLVYKKREGNIREVEKNDIKQKAQVKTNSSFCTTYFASIMMLYFIFERREEKNELLLSRDRKQPVFTFFLVF